MFHPEVKEPHLGQPLIRDPLLRRLPAKLDLHEFFLLEIRILVHDPPRHLGVLLVDSLLLSESFLVHMHLMQGGGFLLLAVLLLLDLLEEVLVL